MMSAAVTLGLAALFDPVRDLIPGSRNNRELPQRGYGDKALRRHLTELFDVGEGQNYGQKENKFCPYCPDYCP